MVMVFASGGRKTFYKSTKETRNVHSLMYSPGAAVLSLLAFAAGKTTVRPGFPIHPRAGRAPRAPPRYNRPCVGCQPGHLYLGAVIVLEVGRITER